MMMKDKSRYYYSWAFLSKKMNCETFDAGIEIKLKNF